MEQLSHFYRQVMESINLQIDEHGNAMYMDHDGPMPFLVSDGRKKFAIIHPTRASLQRQDPTKQWAFHPLCESVVRGQSPMLKALRQGCMARLEVSIGMLMVQLLELAADTDKHSKISAKGLDLLRHIPKADVETVERMGKILNVLNGEDRKFINFYVKQGGEVRGQQAQRSTIVTFPFVKEFANVERRIYSVDLRKKDMETIPALFDWLFPGSQDINTYSAGSSSAVAPYFHSLMTAYVNVAKRINQVCEIFKKHLEPEVRIQLDFAEQLDNLIVFRDAMPPMNGNDGEVTHHSGSAAERVQQNVEKQTLAMPPAPTPVAAPAAVAAPAGQQPYYQTLQHAAALAPKQPDNYPAISAPSLGKSLNAASDVTGVRPGNDDNKAAEWDAVVQMRTNPVYAYNAGYAAIPIPMPWLKDQPQQPMHPAAMYQQQMLLQQQQMQLQMAQQAATGYPAGYPAGMQPGQTYGGHSGI